MALNSKYSLILASNSPRRKELLGWVDIPFTIQGSDVEEVSDATDPVEVALDIAKLKGESVWDVLIDVEVLNPLIVASDTLVELRGKIYGKPSSVDDARMMLQELSGNWHKVVTSVYLKGMINNDAVSKSFAVVTKVKFADIGEDILEPYLNSGESMDKAGAYGIQGKGLTFVEAIEGSYSNVVGFPLNEFIGQLKDFLGCGPDETNWRDRFRC